MLVGNINGGRMQPFRLFAFSFHFQVKSANWEIKKATSRNLNVEKKLEIGKSGNLKIEKVKSRNKKIRKSRNKKTGNRESKKAKKQKTRSDSRKRDFISRFRVFAIPMSRFLNFA